MSHSYVRISQSDEYPAKVVEQLQHAEALLLSENLSFDANVLAQAQEVILDLISFADSLVACVEWNMPPDNVIASYLNYRGKTIQIEKENDIHE